MELHLLNVINLSISNAIDFGTLVAPVSFRNTFRITFPTHSTTPDILLELRSTLQNQWRQLSSQTQRSFLVYTI
jgi:hypothetical protein